LQPIIIIALLVLVVVSFTGIGIQQVQSWNQLDVLVQQYGWAEKDIEPPVSDVSVKLLLEKVLNDNETPDPTDDFVETFVKGCIFSSTQGMLEGTGLAPGKVICKLMNAEGNAIAEGKAFFFSYEADEPLEIIIFQRISIESIKLNNIFDVTAVVEAPI